IMITHYMGQRLVAANLGAIFNAGIASQLSEAPQSVASQLPTQLDRVVSALNNPHLGASASAFLRHAIYVATHHIYMGILVFAVLTLVVTIAAPRHFPLVHDDRNPG